MKLKDLIKTITANKACITYKSNDGNYECWHIDYETICTNHYDYLHYVISFTQLPAEVLNRRVRYVGINKTTFELDITLFD